jgi:hypothetical protein
LYRQRSCTGSGPQSASVKLDFASLPQGILTDQAGLVRVQCCENRAQVRAALFAL